MGSFDHADSQFGFAGVAAGLAGMPRRVIDASYGGEAPAAWGIYSGVIGAGASIMALGLLAYVGCLGWSLVYRRRVIRQQVATVALTAPSGAVFQRAVLTGPLSVALLVAAMYRATMLAFGVMQSLPVVMGGGAGHGGDGNMRQDSSLIALVALVWLALAGLYAFVPMFSIPGSARVWGAGAVVFILLAGCLWLAEKGSRGA